MPETAARPKRRAHSDTWSLLQLARQQVHDSQAQRREFCEVESRWQADSVVFDCQSNLGVLPAEADPQRTVSALWKAVRARIGNQLIEHKAAWHRPLQIHCDAFAFYRSFDAIVHLIQVEQARDKTSGISSQIDRLKGPGLLEKFMNFGQSK